MERWRENAAFNLGQPVPRSAIKEYGLWRQKASSRVMEALAFYARYLVGQFSGMGEALSLESLRFACVAEAIPPSRWPDLTEEMQMIHRIVVARAKEKPADGR